MTTAIASAARITADLILDAHDQVDASQREAYWFAQANSAIDFRHDGAPWVHAHGIGWVPLDVARERRYAITVRVGNTAGC